MAIFAALVLAAPASVGSQPSPPAAIASAVGDCWAAVGPGSVDQTVLRQRGWQPGKFTGAPAGVPTSLHPFGKSGANVILLVTASAGKPTCSVVSRVESAAAVSTAAQAVQQALVAADPEVKTARSGKSIVFLALPRIATLDATGTKDKPGVRIVAGYNAEQK